MVCRKRKIPVIDRRTGVSIQMENAYAWILLTSNSCQLRCDNAKGVWHASYMLDST